tara:strand:+ start:2385 stop:2663 length:279 start_codon:yes stop_codon:yes gene_type:complete
MNNATYSASHCIFASLIINRVIHWRAVELVEECDYELGRGLRRAQIRPDLHTPGMISTEHNYWGLCPALAVDPANVARRKAEAEAFAALGIF